MPKISLLPAGTTGTGAEIYPAVQSGTTVKLTAGRVAESLVAGSLLREKLSAPRTYYVLKTGSDSNTGLSNTASGAFLTMGKAVDVLCDTIDCAGYQPKISVGPGTWTEDFILLRNVVGLTGITNQRGVGPIIQGDRTTPGNVIFTGTFASWGPGSQWVVNGFKLTTGGASLVSLYGHAGGWIRATNVVFGTCAGGNHMQADYGGTVEIQPSDDVGPGTYAISGGASTHMTTNYNGQILILNAFSACAVTGTPAFTAFAVCAARAFINCSLSAGYSGGATGIRYVGVSRGDIYTTGAASANFFPGDVAGSSDATSLYA